LFRLIIALIELSNYLLSVICDVMHGEQTVNLHQIFSFWLILSVRLVFEGGLVD